MAMAGAAEPATFSGFLIMRPMVKQLRTKCHHSWWWSESGDELKAVSTIESRAVLIQKDSRNEMEEKVRIIVLGLVGGYILTLVTEQATVEQS